jgi:hypothetical protein
MRKRIRFVEEYHPITDRTYWFTEERWWPGWFYVNDTMAGTEEEGRAKWERIKRLGKGTNKKVLDHATI